MGWRDVRERSKRNETNRTASESIDGSSTGSHSRARVTIEESWESGGTAKWARAKRASEDSTGLTRHTEASVQPSVAESRSDSGGGGWQSASASLSGKQSPKEEQLERVREYDDHIKEASEKFDISAEQIRAIIAKETLEAQPDEENGAAYGLMQITERTWKHTRERIDQLSEYDFETYWDDPRVNILFGAAIFANKMESVAADAEKANEAVYTALALIAYNAGQGTVNNAIERAKADGSQTPLRDAMKREYMVPAIENTGVYGYWMDKDNVSDETEAAELKYDNEIADYADDVRKYMQLQDVESGTDTKQTDESETDTKQTDESEEGGLLDTVKEWLDNVLPW